MRRNAETVSVRVREETYSQVKAIAKSKGVKAVDIFDEMFAIYTKTPSPPPQTSVNSGTDSSYRSVGKYISNRM